MSKHTYYHWTCLHGRPGIEHTHRVLPNTKEGAMGVSWWTDLVGKGRFIRSALGLSSLMLECDRMQHRYQIDDRDKGLLIPWVLFKPQVSPAWAAELESGQGVQPEHWWVATEPIRVKR